MQNFIANGIKYRDSDTKPHIIITTTSTDDNNVKIEVKDNGIGIEEKYRAEIFKMFRRLHSRDEYEPCCRSCCPILSR